MKSMLTLLPKLTTLLLMLSLGVWLGRCFTPLPDSAGEGGGEGSAAVVAQSWWTCSMDPSVKAPKMGLCPVCGMDLIPLVEEQGGNPRAIRLDEGQKALAGIRVVTVKREERVQVTELVGKLAVAEPSLSMLTAWVEGRVDVLHVKSEGEVVEAGDVLAEVYSPSLTHMQEEWRVASAEGGALEEATRRKLLLLGLTEGQLQQILDEDAASDRLSIRAPYGGTVLKRHVSEGQYVDTGALLFTLADLSTLWLELDAFESNLAVLELGQEVRFTVDAMPGEVFQGRVGFLDPTLDPLTRVVHLRVEVANPEGRLRPEMFAEARILSIPKVDGEYPLWIPASAPLVFGDRGIVFVELEDEELHGARIYEARDVQLGARSGASFQVLSGLKEGDRVVERGAFAIDSELQLRGRPSMMSADMEPVVPTPDPQAEVDLPFRKLLTPVLFQMVELNEALASDDAPDALRVLREVDRALTSMREEPVPDSALQDLVEMRRRVASMASATGLEGIREHLEPLQDAAIRLCERFGYRTLGPRLAVHHCPMASEDGADWIDFAGDGIRNPYYGSGMLQCGSEKRGMPASPEEE